MGAQHEQHSGSATTRERTGAGGDLRGHQRCALDAVPAFRAGVLQELRRRQDLVPHPKDWSEPPPEIIRRFKRIRSESHFDTALLRGLEDLS